MKNNPIKEFFFKLIRTHDCCDYLMMVFPFHSGRRCGRTSFAGLRLFGESHWRQHQGGMLQPLCRCIVFKVQRENEFAFRREGEGSSTVCANVHLNDTNMRFANAYVVGGIEDLIDDGAVL